MISLRNRLTVSLHIASKITSPGRRKAHLDLSIPSADRSRWTDRRSGMPWGKWSANMYSHCPSLPETAKRAVLVRSPSICMPRRGAAFSTKFCT